MCCRVGRCEVGDVESERCIRSCSGVVSGDDNVRVACLFLSQKVVSRKVLGKEKKSMRESRQALLRAALIRDPRESGVLGHCLEQEGHRWYWE